MLTPWWLADVSLRYFRSPRGQLCGRFSAASRGERYDDDDDERDDHDDEVTAHRWCCPQGRESNPPLPQPILPWPRRPFAMVAAIPAVRRAGGPGTICLRQLGRLAAGAEAAEDAVAVDCRHRGHEQDDPVLRSLDRDALVAEEILDRP